MPTLTKQVALVVVQKNPLLTRASSHNTYVCSLTHYSLIYTPEARLSFFGKKNGDTNKSIVPIAASIGSNSLVPQSSKKPEGRLVVLRRYRFTQRYERLYVISLEKRGTKQLPGKPIARVYIGLDIGGAWESRINLVINDRA